ncbi:MAG: ATP-binding protein, partial [Bacteroidetes bacterium]|nr:ATP-binding protein [Bacteroidota bacterium]
MNELELMALITGGEMLTVEFKGEGRKPLGDRELALVCVCLANGAGGTLLVGVEKDGSITGAKPRHGDRTDPDKLRALVRNMTMPALEVEVVLHHVAGSTVIEIQVPKAESITSHSDSTCQRRILDNDGPACVPYYPHEHGGGSLRL